MNVRERLEKCLVDESMRAPQCRQMVKLLNEDGRYRATIQDWSYDTSRKVPGRRFVYEHTERDGHRVEVYEGHERLICHDTCEPYRTNRELAEQVLALLEKKP